MFGCVTRGRTQDSLPAEQVRVDNTRTESTLGRGSMAGRPAEAFRCRADSKGSSGEPGGTRTRDPLLKRQMLYLLSYWPVGGVSIHHHNICCRRPNAAACCSVNDIRLLAEPRP